MPAAQTTTFSISNFLREQFGRAQETLARLRVKEEEAPTPDDTPWQQYWGEAYGLKLKQWLLMPVFEMLEAKNHVGDLIVDVGSGARPVTQFLQPRAGRKRIFVDVAADNRRSGDEQKIRLDVEKVGEPGALSFRKALLRVCRFLEIAPGTGADSNGADMIVFADLLNYVDFRKVLGGFANYLKPGGRLVVVNLPMRGNQSLFSEKGLKDNGELYQFLEERRFEIEHKAFPCRPRGETDESEELIVLVARKCG
jgi:SAM-dependent methyltransferase